MNTILRAGLGFALCAAAAACSSTSTTPAADTAPAAAPAPVTAFDGVYRGKLVRVRAPSMHANKVCVGTHYVTLRITNGSVSYAQTKKTVFTSDIAADGTFSSTVGDETLKGTAADKGITGTLDGKNCGYTLTAMKHG